MKLPRIGRISRLGLAYFAVLIIAIVVGSIIGGGTGTTITAIAGILLALTILGTYGLGEAARDGVSGRGRRYGRSLDDEEEDHRTD
jgi:hypothetical protein